MTGCDCTACVWADQWLAKLLRSPVRRARLERERIDPQTKHIKLARFRREQPTRKEVA